MCGRFAFYDISKFYSRFNVKNKLNDIQARYNIAPGSNFPIVTSGADGNEAYMMKWGLVPFWAKDSKIGYKMINARSETVLEKPAFRRAIKSQRCLVPANGFYEWNKENGKQPYFIHFEANEMFAMAGMYGLWKDVEGRELKTFTIMTTNSNKLISKIHDRMPVILDQKNEEKWMSLDTPMEDAISLLKTYNDGLMMDRVADRVNKATIDDKELIKPVI